MNPTLHATKTRVPTTMFQVVHADAVVDLGYDDDLGFWTAQLDCSSEKLLAAVESVGPRVEHVTEYLRAGW